MAQSTQQVVSDGTLAQLAISINYLDRVEISVFFNDVLTSAWTWVGATRTINFNVVVPNGVVVLVKRTTDITKLRHTFSDGAAFTASTLDEDLTQVLHIAQEAQEANLSGEFYTDVNMHGYRLRNVHVPIDDSDALTWGQAKADGLTASAAAVSASASQSAASASQSAAANSAALTSASQSAASLSAAAAASSEIAAAIYTNVARWVSGGNYSTDTVRFSPANGFNYRALQAANGRTVDPSIDTLYWGTALSVPINAGGTGANTQAGARTSLDVPSRTGANASGTWDVNITGSSASCSGNSGTATTAANAIGQGQTWQNVVGSRAVNTAYTNSTGRSIALSVGLVDSIGSSNATILIGGAIGVAYATLNSTSSVFTLYAIIPPGAVYSVSALARVTTNFWSELR